MTAHAHRTTTPTPRSHTHRAIRLAAAVLVALLATPASAQKVYTYENTSSGSIPELGSNAACNGATSLVRTFTVSDSFTVSTISLGLNLTHADRGQIRAIINAPNGTNLVVLTQTGASGDDPDDNFDIYLSPLTDGAGTNPKDDGSSDPVAEPYYNRLVNLGTNFYTGNASGTWTLRVCDRFTAGGLGTFNRARLVLTSAETASPVCTSRVSFSWCPGCSPSPPAAATTTAFPAGGISAGGVTITRTGTAFSGATASARNFNVVNTQTGGEFGFHAIEWDAASGAAESVRSEATFALTPPVRDLQWKLMDQDRSTWEDTVRVRASDGGPELRYVWGFSDAPSYQVAGEILETDSNSTPADTFGNAFWNFDGPVSSVRSEYWAGDDFTDPAQQFIGFGTALYCAFDYGDAPDTYSTALSGGARHVLGNRTLYLGTNPPDGEGDGVPGATALDDDATQLSGIDDEDGLVGTSLPACTSAASYTVPMTATNLSGSPGYLVGYIDWNRDGDFAEANERSSTVTVAAGTNTVNVVWASKPANCGGTTPTYARFRIAGVESEVTSPTGLANSGEVEDYRTDEGTLPVTIAHVASAVEGDSLVVRFTTASEWANAGFTIWGRAGKGKWFPLGEVDAVQPDSMSPQRYEATVSALGVEQLVIEDVSLFGERRSHGPFKVGSEHGEEPEAMTIDWATVREEAEAARRGGISSHGLALRATAATASEGLLLVREEGIHRVTHEQLLAAGIDLSGTPAARIGLYDEGKAVARFVGTPAGTFGPGSFIEFVGRPALTLASPVDAYVLRVQRSDIAPPAALATGDDALGTVTAEDLYAPDRAYSFSSPNGDPWYDQGILARGSQASLTRTFDLPDLATGAVELTVMGWGYGDWSGSEPPDHHVVAVLNGTVIADDRFDGMITWERTLDVTSLALPTGNTLEIRVPGDTGYPADYMAFEGYAVRYPRQTVALNGRFRGAPGSNAGLAIGGFANDQTVSLWRLKGKTWQRAEQAASNGRVTAQGGGTLWAAAQDAALVPGISAGVPSPLTSSSAQYVIVTHPAFAGALGDLVALQQGRGLSTEVVTVDSIYAAYSDHATSPHAIKSFLTASFKRRSLQYVLLVGTDTVDPYDHLGRGSMTFVPTSYLSFVQYITFSPTDEDLVDTNGDGVGEVPIGRLPVRTAAELQEVVAKIRTWEQNVAAVGRSALLASGAAAQGESFSSVNRSYHRTLTTWGRTMSDTDQSGNAAVRAAVLAAMNAGTPLVSYVGHSSAGQWDFTSVLRWQDAATLTNAGRPNLVVQWGCWNAYYVDPATESLSGRLLRTAGVGAAAAIGATTLTNTVSHQELGTLLFAELDGAPQSLGTAFHNAKVALARGAAPRDALLGMALLGDPAMSMPR